MRKLFPTLQRMTAAIFAAASLLMPMLLLTAALQSEPRLRVAIGRDGHNYCCSSTCFCVYFSPQSPPPVPGMSKLSSLVGQHNTIS